MKEKNFDQIGYQNEYIKKHYDRFCLILPKGFKSDIKSTAESEGMSMNAFIITAIEIKIREHNADYGKE